MASQALDDISTSIKETPITSGRLSSIRITHRSGRSVLTHLVHILVRRIRNYLGRPRKQYKDVSPKLKPLKVIYKTCSVSERTVCDIHIYDITPHSVHEKKFTRRIYYFCGGGWQSPAEGQHWQLCAKLARQMPETVISLVSYPLAPFHPAPKAFPMLLKLYRTLLQSAEEEGYRVIFAGDSSGGNIILSLVLEALKEDEGNKVIMEGEQQQLPHPVAIMAISPSADLTRSNPEIAKLKQFDPILTPEFVRQTAKAWKGDWDATDRRISPIYADISLFARRQIKVHGVTGGYDILAPDAMAFRKRCEEEGVNGEWLEWEQQMHCFVLTWPYGLRESREGVGWMIDVLKRE